MTRQAWPARSTLARPARRGVHPPRWRRNREDGSGRRECQPWTVHAWPRVRRSWLGFPGGWWFVACKRPSVVLGRKGRSVSRVWTRWDSAAPRISRGGEYEPGSSGCQRDLLLLFPRAGSTLHERALPAGARAPEGLSWAGPLGRSAGPVCWAAGPLACDQEAATRARAFCPRALGLLPGTATLALPTPHVSKYQESRQN
jgi:hypothetical protein